MDISDRIVDYIRRNRVSTTEIADCLGKTGALPGVSALNRGHFRVGVVKWCYAYASSNWPVHEALATTDGYEGKVVFIDAIKCEGRAVIGQLVSKYILLYRQAVAIVVNAPMRDTPELIRENYPIWCAGMNPIGCFNTQPVPLPEEVWAEHAARYNGAIMVCDDCGVVLIPKEKHTDEFLARIVAIEEQEDIWFNRLDHYKDNTFDIVCLKKYLKDA